MDSADEFGSLDLGVQGSGAGGGAESELAPLVEPCAPYGDASMGEVTVEIPPGEGECCLCTKTYEDPSSVESKS